MGFSGAEKSLDEESRKLLSLVDETGVIKLLSDLVRIPSVSYNEKPAAEFVAKKMKEIGLRVEFQEVLPNRPNAIGKVTFNKEGPVLILNSHIDVNPPGDEKQWSVEPFSGLIKGGKVYGRGAADAKGSVAAMLMAIDTIRRAGVQLEGGIIMTAVAAEESTIDPGSGGLGTKDLVEKGILGDFGVVGEPTSLGIHIAHKGAYRPIITVKGRAAHSSTPHLGINAIFKAAKLILALDKLNKRLKAKKHPLVGFPTIATTMINGGIKPNTIPDTCDLTVCRRLVPGESRSLIRDEIEEVFEGLKAEDPEFEAKITKVLIDIEPAEISSDEEIVKIAREAVKEVIGKDSGVSGLVGTCDMNFLVNRAKIPTLILGPGNIAQAHSPDEHVEVKQLSDAVKIYSLIILRALKPANVA